MKNFIKKIINSKYTLVTAKLILGTIFVYASVGKILNPAAFSEIIENFKILPSAYVDLAAYVLPWIEMILGSLLILNIQPKICTLFIIFLLVIFMLAIGFNLVKGINVNCGCFSQRMQEVDSGFTQMWIILFRDLMYILIGVFIYKKQ